MNIVCGERWWEGWTYSAAAKEGTTLDSHSRILNNNPPIPRSSNLPKSVQPLTKRQNSQYLRYNLEKFLGSSFKFHCISPILPTVPPWLFSSYQISTSQLPNSSKDRPHPSCIDLIFKKSSTLILTLPSATRMPQNLKIKPVLPFQSTTALKLTVTATPPPHSQLSYRLFSAVLSIYSHSLSHPNHLGLLSCSRINL